MFLINNLRITCGKKLKIKELKESIELLTKFKEKIKKIMI